MPDPSQGALLVLASIRAASGPPLTIEVAGRGMTQEQRERCNAMVELVRKGAGKTPLNKVVFLTVAS